MKIRPALFLVLLGACGEDEQLFVFQPAAPPPAEVACTSGAPWVERMAPPDVERGLGGVWGPGDGSLVAAGEFGTVLSYDRTVWTNTSPRLSQADLRAVHGTARDDVWAAGREGVVMHFDGREWSLVETGVTTDWASVWATSRTSVWIAGDAGVRRWDGARFTEPTGAPRGPIAGLWASGPDDVWMVGATSVHRWDGRTFIAQPFERVDTLFAIWGKSGGRVWVIGRSLSNQPGLAERVNQDWIFGNAPPRAVFFSVWTLDAGEILVGASQSSIFRRDGESWCRELGGGTGAINAFFGTSHGDVWAVGAKRDASGLTRPLIYERVR